MGKRSERKQARQDLKQRVLPIGKGGTLDARKKELIATIQSQAAYVDTLLGEQFDAALAMLNAVLLSVTEGCCDSTGLGAWTAAMNSDHGLRSKGNIVEGLWDSHALADCLTA
tara:strand:+ start:40 stop:378 length:339 start_codon:yes stop_codon:yes gene_type:complete